MIFNDRGTSNLADFSRYIPSCTVHPLTTVPERSQTETTLRPALSVALLHFESDTPHFCMNPPMPSHSHPHDSCHVGAPSERVPCEVARRHTTGAHLALAKQAPPYTHVARDRGEVSRHMMAAGHAFSALPCNLQVRACRPLLALSLSPDTVRRGPPANGAPLARADLLSRCRWRCRRRR
jgi:hypothetical protein